MPLWPLKMQTQGDRMCAEIAAKLFIIWGEVFGEAFNGEFVL